MFDLQRIQARLTGVDGWLFFDHHHRDPIAYRVLGLDANSTITRRWFYRVPAAGPAIKIHHRIESWALDLLPGDTIEYSTWQELHGALRTILSGAESVAMQYSPACALPASSVRS